MSRALTEDSHGKGGQVQEPGPPHLIYGWHFLPQNCPAHQLRCHHTLFNTFFKQKAL